MIAGQEEVNKLAEFDIDKDDKRKQLFKKRRLLNSAYVNNKKFQKYISYSPLLQNKNAENREIIQIYDKDQIRRKIRGKLGTHKRIKSNKKGKIKNILREIKKLSNHDKLKRPISINISAHAIRNRLSKYQNSTINTSNVTAQYKNFPPSKTRKGSINEVKINVAQRENRNTPHYNSINVSTKPSWHPVNQEKTSVNRQKDLKLKIT
jgi:hypothetical protein